MRIFLNVFCLLTISSTVFAADSNPPVTAGPFVCACESIYNESELYSRIVVTDLSNGKIYRFGKFVGGNFFPTKNGAQGSQRCTEAIAVQAICRNGTANQ